MPALHPSAPPPTLPGKKLSYTRLMPEPVVLGRFFNNDPWTISRELGEDSSLQALNLTHIEPASLKPYSRDQGPRLGIKWLNALDKHVRSNPQEAFPHDWRESILALKGTELLAPDGVIHVMTFVYAGTGWRYDYAPVHDPAENMWPLVYNPNRKV